MQRTALPDEVGTVVRGWPLKAQTAFDGLRRIVLDVAADCPDVDLIETLKWGEPAWLPRRVRVGSTLRAAWKPQRAGQIGLFVICNTSVAGTLRDLYPDAFKYEGRRALYLDLDAPLPTQAIAHCAALTLTYHRKTA